MISSRNLLCVTINFLGRYKPQPSQILPILKEITFPDHHNYTQANIDAIKLQARYLNAKIITTEKDYVKISSNKNDEIKFLKIELKVKNEKELIDYLKLHI